MSDAEVERPAHGADALRGVRGAVVAGEAHRAEADRPDERPASPSRRCSTDPRLRRRRRPGPAARRRGRPRSPSSARFSRASASAGVDEHGQHRRTDHRRRRVGRQPAVCTPTSVMATTRERARRHQRERASAPGGTSRRLRNVGSPRTTRKSARNSGRLGDRGRALEEAVEVEGHAAADEEERDQQPVADRVQLVPQVVQSGASRVTNPSTRPAAKAPRIRS